MRVQLLSINYAPEHTGIAPYSTALAAHLAESHDVTVLTGLPHYPDWHVAAEDRHWRTEQQCDDVRVIRLQHFVPKQPGVVGRAAYELSWATRAAAVGVRIPADVVIAVVPALFGAHAARIIARYHHAPLGVIVQDIMGNAAAQSGVKGGQLVSKLTSAIERKALDRASSIATIHPRLAAELSRLTNRPETPKVIYNWMHLRDATLNRTNARKKFGWSDNDVIALHSGNMGIKQNLEVLIDAARIAAPLNSKVRFVLAGGGSQRIDLERYARGCSNVTFLDSVEEAVYPDLLASADVLLVNERPGMREMSLPSKLTSYLNVGRPIVAATDLHSATADFVRASGGGVIVPAGQPDQIHDAVRALAADQGLSQRLSSEGQRFAAGNLSQDKALAAYDEWVDELASQRVLLPV